MLNKNILLIGALTSKPYSFKSRNWELKNIRTIDIFDSLCSNIKVDIKGYNIVRVLPINNKNVNDYWISDKTRHAYDGLKRKRFINPMKKKNSLFIECSWRNIWIELQKIFLNKDHFYNNLIIKTGNYNNLEHIISLKKFVINVNQWINVLINTERNLNADLIDYYLLDIDDFFHFSKKSKKIFLFFNTDISKNNPILNIKINKLRNKTNVLILFLNDYLVTNSCNSNNNFVINLILKGKHKFCTLIQNFLKKNLHNKKLSSIFWNQCSLISEQGLEDKSFNLKVFTRYFNKIQKVVKFKINMITNYTSNINIQEIGFFNNFKHINGVKSIFYLLNCEKIENIKKEDFVIFQGHHNLNFYKRFNIILPTTVWVEDSNLHLNCFGNLQKTQFCLTPPKNVKSDWKVTYKILFLSKWYFTYELLKKKIMKNNSYIDRLNWYERKKKVFFFIKVVKREVSENIYFSLLQTIPNFLFYIDKSFCIQTNKFKYNLSFNIKLKQNHMPRRLNIYNYYIINNIDKVSINMQNCDNFINKNNNNFNKKN